MKRTLSSILCLFAVAMAAHGDITFTMKDGKVVTVKSLRRQGDNLMGTVEMTPAQEGKPAQTGELGYPVAQVAKIDFPEPPQLKTAADLITKGKATDALAQIEPVLKYYEGFRDAPGSWWADLALLKVQAFVSQGRDADVEPIIQQIYRLATDPETTRAAKTLSAAGFVRRGEPAKALELCNVVLKESTRPETLAQAYITSGQSHLALKEWDPALISFLEIPVFYPDSKVLQPPSMLGAGQAYEALQDFTRAKATLNDLIGTYGATAEAKQAKVELEKIARTEKALDLVK